MKRVVWAVFGLLLASCGNTSGMTASVISTLGTVGPGHQRVLVEVSDEEGETVSFDESPTAVLRDENGSPVDSAEGELVWLIPDDAPAYAFEFDIPVAETYQITVETPDGEIPPAGLVVGEAPLQPSNGEVAPTTDGVSGSAIVVFASPDWCPSMTCQPMLDSAADAADSAGIAFVHIEVFADTDVESEDDLELAPVVEEWGLPSQPWLFVIDSEGVVVAGFEGGVGQSELDQALASVGAAP